MQKRMRQVNRNVSPLMIFCCIGGCWLFVEAFHFIRISFCRVLLLFYFNFFSNIEELQELNTVLTSKLREAEAKRDEMVQQAQKQQCVKCSHFETIYVIITG